MSESVPKWKPSVVACAVLLTLFAVTAWLAIGTKSPAYDEPYHAISSWVQLRYFDFRIDNEDPPLWQYWAASPNARSALTADFSGEIWKSMPASVVRQWYWGVQTLYRTPGNDPEKLIARCRAMMLIVAIALGVLICTWAWRLGGPVAAIVATYLFSLDPNFLAHSPLMKNDVAFAASMFALVLVLWMAGKKLTLARLVWIVVLCIVTLTTKFSGIVAVLLVPMLLVLRALLPAPWHVFGRIISSPGHRLLLSAGITLLAMLGSYGGIWAVYGFRFRPTPGQNVWLNLDQITGEIRANAMIARYHGLPPPGATADSNLPIPAEIAIFANHHALLPQAFIGGFLFTYANGIVRFAYANGQISAVGWWWYFPFAILVKTPVATLLAIAICAVTGVRRLVMPVLRDWEEPGGSRDNRGSSENLRTGVFWTSVCLLVPAALFLASAMLSNLNIGIRHVLSIYPFLFVAIGVIAARQWQTGYMKPRATIIALGLLLAIETFSACPNFIAYFNFIATNTTAGKLQLLGDSNLDWGQDLTLLAQWQHEHPYEKLYLCYFGYADPKYYGIKYIPLPGGYHYDSSPHFPDPYEPSVLAISASNLQGFLLDPRLRAYYRKWAAKKPLVVLGDSIYLYDFDPVENLKK
jgi:hypothetical protein